MPADPEKDNHTFDGWKPSVPSTLDYNRSFIAQWTPNVCVFTFNLNGGNIGGSTASKTTSGDYGTASTKPLEPVRTNYTFVGWNPSVPNVYDGNKTFTAQWTTVTYTFTFKLNGGNIGGSTTDKTTKGAYNTRDRKSVV